MPFGAYVFDMDGVISDTQKIHAAHEYEFIQTLTRGQEVFYKGSVLTPDRITAEFAGIKATKWIGDILASSGIYKTPEELEAHLVRLHTHLAQEMQNTTILVEEIPGSR